MRRLLHLEENFLNELEVVDWGYTEEAIPSSYEKFNSWINEGKHGPLNYLSDHRKELRKSLASVNSNFQSALVFLFSYASDKAALEDFYKSKHSNGLKVAGYALAFGGEDYHSELRRRLDLIGREIGGEYKISLDIQPVLERDLAYRSGLGWFGKNSMLIHPKKGSFNMIGSLLFEKKLPLGVTQPELDHCGQCTACLEICPTNAIDIEKRQIIASKCISTFTIEIFKDEEAPAGYESASEIFGCDLCQDVCPWNKRMHRVNDPSASASTSWPGKKGVELVDFFLKQKFSDLKNSLESLSGRGYQRLFKGTSFERTGKLGLLKNLKERD